MRLLPARLHRQRLRPAQGASLPRPRDDPRVDGRQPLSLHRLRRHQESYHGGNVPAEVMPGSPRGLVTRPAQILPCPSASTATVRVSGFKPSRSTRGRRVGVSSFIATGANDFKPRFAGSLCLANVVRHQALQTKFLHRGQMEPVYRAAVNLSRVTMLAKRGPEQSGRESAKLIGCLMTQDGKSSLQLAPARASQIPRQIVGLELDHHFQFRQGRHGHLRLPADRLQHLGTLRFRAEDLHQAA